MQMKKRVEHLEQVFFPDSKRHGFYLWELSFRLAFLKKYEGCMGSAPEVLRRGYEGVALRGRR